MEQNETPISKAIKAKLRLVDDEVEEAWLGDRSHIYAELDPLPYFTATPTVDITHIHHRAQIESFAAITAILVKRKAKLMIAKALEALSNVDSDENLQVDMENFILTFFDYSAYGQRLPVFVDEVERKLSSWRKDYNREELGLTKIEDLFQSYVKDALRTARNEIDVEFTLLRTQTTAKHSEVTEEADKSTSNRLSERYVSKKKEVTEKENIFRHDGDFWTISYEGEAKPVKDTKGIHYIAYLLQNKTSLVGATELVRAFEGPFTDVGTKEFAKMSEEQLNEYHLRKTSYLNDTKMSSVSKDKDEYKRMLYDINNEIVKAEKEGDSLLLKELQGQKEDLLNEVKANFGKKGRFRKSNQSEEKARKAVTACIRNAIKRIQKEHPSLGDHLSQSIKTGTDCVYNPGQHTPWTVQF